MPSKLGGNSIGVHINQIKTEAKLEVKQEPLNDFYMIHDNSNQNAKPTKEGENLELKKESYFDEVYEEMAIDFVTSKTFDKDYLKLTKNQSSSNSNYQNLCETKKAKCLECDKKFSQKSTLYYHNKVVHEKKDDTNLSKVHERRNKSFDTNASSERNLEMKPFFCKNKDKNGKTRDKKGKLKCSQCDNTYNKEYNLKHHVKIVHERKNFIGREIDAVFKSRKEITTHNDEIHEGPKHKCTLCDKDFLKRATVFEHIKAVHWMKDDSALSTVHERNKSHVHERKKSHYCMICHSKFRLKSRLNRHIKEDHEKQQFRQNCPMCSHTFSHISRLNAHMVSVHEGKTSKENQKDNQKEVHEKQSRLNCSLCSRTFSHIGRLNTHMVSFHEGKKSK